MNQNSYTFRIVYIYALFDRKLPLGVPDAPPKLEVLLLHILGGERELEGERLAHGVLWKSKKKESAVSVGAVIDVVLKVKSEISMVFRLNLDPGIVILLLPFLCLDDFLLCSDDQSQRHSQIIVEECRVSLALSSGLEYKLIVRDDKLSL